MIQHTNDEVSAVQIEARRAFGIQTPEAPLCVSYGLGVDSTAMLVAMHRAGVRPDLITFADTGDEKPETYDYLPVMQTWLASVGLPAVVIVRYGDYAKHGRYRTLYENCIANATLPSLAFGGKGCSLKFKAAVQNAYRALWAPARAWWASGRSWKEDTGRRDKHGRVVYEKRFERRVTVCIGYDAGPKDSKRGAIAADGRYDYEYPLRKLGWDRERCMREIAAEGLPVPPKSACFYCPSTTPTELAELVERHPHLADKIVAMEATAAPKLTTIQGLWRTGCKGTRGGEAKPGSMTVFIEAVRARRALPVLQQPAATVCGGCEA